MIHPTQIINKPLIFLTSIVLISGSVIAAPPSGYYDSISASSAQALHESLHAIIDDHQRFPYSSSSTDTWDILEVADQDPEDSSRVLDIYKNASYTKQGGGNNFYNREHSWPKSYGFPSSGTGNYPYTDSHHLFISNVSYNGSRGNKPFDNCASGCVEEPTDFNNNRGGTASQSNFTVGEFASGKWETWLGRRGEVARALMYMAVRYDGGNHGVTGYSEPDLRLTDNRSLIEQSSTGANLSVAYMGLKSVLLEWHQQDPVDDIERRRNDIVYNYQGNRNPFIDHPEYVRCVFTDDCSGLGGGASDTTPPAKPVGLTANGRSEQINLSWSANSESDLLGYFIYRSNGDENNFIQLNSDAISNVNFTDSNLAASTRFDYYVTAVDSASNESVASHLVSATTEASSGNSDSHIWINELHYDNRGYDRNEFVELAGPAGTDLSGWKLLGYNGNGGTVYKTVNLSGTIAEQANGFGTKSFIMSGLQNGAPDGIALVDNVGALVQFISYEGSFKATSGAAKDVVSQNIGVSETSSTSVGYSLQLSGHGTYYSDFSWNNASFNSAGKVNANQSFRSDSTQPIARFSFSCTYLACEFDASSSSSPAGAIDTYTWHFGDGVTTTGVAPIYIFNTAGDYDVTLDLLAIDGGTDSVSQSLSVEEQSVPPVAECPIGYVEHTGFLAGSGDSNAEPNGNYYYENINGNHSAILMGPDSANFDLRLYKWNGQWTDVAKGISDDSNEQVSYEGSAGYYYWRVQSYFGSGDYLLCLSRP